MTQSIPDQGPLPSHGRYAHSAITRRPKFQWPNGRRLAVYFALGVEHYAFGEGMTENLVSGMPHPDVLNTSWREYGNRVGAWRVLRYFADVGIPLSILLNSAVCEHAPDLIDAARLAGCEFIAHGYSNSDTLAGRAEADEALYIERVASQMEGCIGTRPLGWASPWIAETLHTPDILAETTNRCGWRRARGRSWPCRIPRRSTTVRQWSVGSRAPRISPP
jgi:peptidoglycan/xylan/chitin deacetylase (PgdA/CDA1 family)